MPEDLKLLLCDGAKNYGVEISDEMAEKFYRYMLILKEWNEKINLTAIVEPQEIFVKHFVDSLSVIPFLKKSGAKTVADVGTGAGFPGFPIKICCPEIKLTLIDSLDKRIKFLEFVASELKLQNVKCLHGRAEDIGANPMYREKFDFVTARAVAAMPVLMEYCMPLVKTGGHFLAMKGGNAIENEKFDSAAEILGAGNIEISEFMLPGTDMKRCLFYMKKTRQLSTKYPRKAGIPSKKPL